jgi:hypothetical protein
MILTVTARRAAPTDAQLVVTPSLHIHLICHFMPPS